MEERKARRKAKKEQERFAIDPIKAKKMSSVDKNPFRKKPLPQVTSPMIESIRTANIEENKESKLNIS